MSTGLAALVVGVLRLLVDLFFPKQQEKAHVVSDPRAATRPYARPERLRSFGRDADGNLGEDGDAGAHR
jgi:hypothetical protein